MKVTIKHYGYVKAGKKVYYNPELYRNQLAALEGKEFTEVITQKHEKPSRNMHNYYRGGILPTCLASEMFSHYDTTEDIHEGYFRRKFLRYVVVVTNLDGSKSEETRYRSTADLSKQEMSEFVNKVKMDCEMNGITIAEPDQYYSKFYNK